MERVNQTFFLSHGSPTLSIDDKLEARHFFKSWKDKVFQHKPTSILVISAHWDTEFPSVNTADRSWRVYYRKKKRNVEKSEATDELKE